MTFAFFRHRQKIAVFLRLNLFIVCAFFKSFICSFRTLIPTRKEAPSSSGWASGTARRSGVVNAPTGSAQKLLGDVLLG